MGKGAEKLFFAFSQEESSFCLARSGDKRGLSLRGQHIRLCVRVCVSAQIFILLPAGSGTVGK